MLHSGAGVRLVLAQLVAAFLYHLPPPSLLHITHIRHVRLCRYFIPTSLTGRDEALISGIRVAKNSDGLAYLRTSLQHKKNRQRNVKIFLIIIFKFVYVNNMMQSYTFILTFDASNLVYSNINM